MRGSYDCVAVNQPKTIAGIEWKLFVVVFAFFGFAAMVFHVLYLLITPILVLAFLRGPGKKDPLFLRIHLRHRAQRDVYSPAYVSKPNLRNPRPQGFGKTHWF